MTVWVVLYDSATYDLAASWTVDAIFSTELAAEKYKSLQGNMFEYRIEEMEVRNE